MAATIEQLYADWHRIHDYIGRLGKVFAVGCAKSGTTWIQNLLDGHDEIVLKGEGAFAYQLLPLLSQAFARFNEHQRNMPEYTRLRDVDLLLTLRALVDGQFARYVEVSGCDPRRLRVVGDKTPQHSIGMLALAQIYPEARFIHVIRDPRDAAVSAWHHFGQSDGRPFEQYIEYFITRVWPVNVSIARRAGQTLGARYLEIRYEDLHADEADHVRRMLAFLGVDSSEAAVRQCLESGSFERRSGGRARGQTDNRHFYRRGQAGGWVDELPAELASRCCAPVAELMAACGYDPASVPTPAPA